MKINPHVDMHKRMSRQDKLYGITTMGVRGQVVIPADARKDLSLKPGDQLLVMGKFGKALGFIKADEMESFVNTIMNNLAGTGAEQELKKYLMKFKDKLSKAKH